MKWKLMHDSVTFRMWPISRRLAGRVPAQAFDFPPAQPRHAVGRCMAARAGDRFARDVAQQCQRREMAVAVLARGGELVGARTQQHADLPFAPRTGSTTPLRMPYAAAAS